MYKVKYLNSLYEKKRTHKPLKQMSEKIVHEPSKCVWVRKLFVYKQNENYNCAYYLIHLRQWSMTYLFHGDTFAGEIILRCISLFLSVALVIGYRL